MSRRIYLDNSATTRVAAEVVEAMLPFFSDAYGNASSFHSFGLEARKAIDESRRTIADCLTVPPEGIVFTSGATEADNLAILGLAHADPQKRHVITSPIEHHAVLHACNWLKAQGYEVTFLDVDGSGRVDPAQLKEALRDDTLVVSIMAGNNEIGTVQPIAALGAMCRDCGVPFHTDAVQAFGKVPVPTDVIDLLSVSAHKLHGPKGVGFLYVRPGITVAPLLHGGGHERGMRSGTENTPGIVGLAAAARIAFEEMDVVPPRLRGFRERLIEGVSEIPGTRLNGDRTESLPHIANFSFEAIEGESLIMKLDEHEIAASTGSACSSPNLEASHVLLSIGVPIGMAHGSLRLSTGRDSTDEDIDRALDVLPRVVDELRALSPFKVGE